MADAPTVAEIEAALSGEIARLLCRDVATIGRDLPLHQVGLDSLAFVSLLVFIERQYGLKLIETPLGADAFRSVAELALAIRGLI
jgi:acyl carrier protein